MYVCVCHAVTTRQISASIAQGANTFKALRKELGVATCCGKCSKDVRSQLRAACSSNGDCVCANRR
jgi:bacterioferritin-associated ferredoxin